jgi:hypothetical protein
MSTPPLAVCGSSVVARERCFRRRIFNMVWFGREGLNSDPQRGRSLPAPRAP